MLAVVSRWWDRPTLELTFVTRSFAGAASRFANTAVLTPGPPGGHHKDGAFDVYSIGQDADGGWPGIKDLELPTDFDQMDCILLDSWGDDISPLLDQTNGASVFTVARSTQSGHRQIPVLPSAPNLTDEVGIYVPIAALAAEHRHAGFGFTDYILVLTDRSGAPDPTPPTPMVAWLSAAYPSEYVVAVENGSASAWQGRALRGTVPVDTRMDLWRLIAHARVLVDLAPDQLLGRECVESLRYGTPVLVPGTSAAAVHVATGGGTFDDVSELLGLIDHLSDPEAHKMASEAARSYADAHYGDPVRSIERLRDAIT